MQVWWKGKDLRTQYCPFINHQGKKVLTKVNQRARSICMVTDFTTYLFVFLLSRGNERTAAQRFCVCSRVSGEGGWSGSVLECVCPLQTGGRGVAVQKRLGRRPLWGSDGLQTETAQPHERQLASDSLWTLGKNIASASLASCQFCVDSNKVNFLKFWKL